MLPKQIIRTEAGRQHRDTVGICTSPQIVMARRRFTILILNDKNRNAVRVTRTDDPYESWSPALGYGGYLYFTSNRDGKAEIYYLDLNDKNRNAVRVTRTDDPYESWSPALGYGGYLYFTSNRDGKAEIYYLDLNDKNKDAVRVTQTDNPYGSWSPVVRGQNIYFTSDRTGRDQVYMLTSPWSPSISDLGSWTGISERVPRY